MFWNYKILWAHEVFDVKNNNCKENVLASLMSFSCSSCSVLRDLSGYVNITCKIWKTNIMYFSSWQSKNQIYMYYILILFTYIAYICIHTFVVLKHFIPYVFYGSIFCKYFIFYLSTLLKDVYLISCLGISRWYHFRLLLSNCKIPNRNAPD